MEASSACANFLFSDVMTVVAPALLRNDLRSIKELHESESREEGTRLQSLFGGDSGNAEDQMSSDSLDSTVYPQPRTKAIDGRHFTSLTSWRTGTAADRTRLWPGQRW